MQKSTDYIKSKIGNFKPEIAIVLGSASGRFTENLSGKEILYKNIPHFFDSTVKGHNGKFLFTEIENKKVVIAEGRTHFYEGFGLEGVLSQIKLFNELGIKTLILTNASGSINKKIEPKSIVIIKDHINLMGINPLIGPNDDRYERFPDMQDIYNVELRQLAKKCAKNIGIKIKEGIYVATTGPSYETKAESIMYSKLGGDIVGMSTVLEAIYANYLKMNILAISVATNYSAGFSENKMTHKEVLENGKKTNDDVVKLIFEVLKNI